MINKKQTDDLIDKQLGDKDPRLVKQMAKRGMKFWIKVYQGLCSGCKRAVNKNPSMPFDLYCEKCREKIVNLK